MTPPSSGSSVAAPARLAVGYVRRSTDRQEQSLDDQRRAIEAYATKNGFEIVQWYEDDAISGASVDARRAFKQMGIDAQAPGRGWRFVLVLDVSRFSRGDLDEAGYLRHQFRQAGVEVTYCNEGLSGGDADDLVVGVKQWMAQKYVKDLSKITIRGQISHSEAAGWNGGCPPFGYDLLYHDSTDRPYQCVRWLESGDKEVYDSEGRLTRVVPRGERLTASKRDVAKLVPSTPERVAIVRRIFDEYTGGRGVRSIADRLNRDGIRSPRNGNWSANTHASWSQGTIREIVKNPAYRGDLVWNRRTFAKFNRVGGKMAVERPRIDADKPRENHESDWIVTPGTHEPLILPTLFDRAQELMNLRKKDGAGQHFRVGSGLRSPFLLSGLLTCGRCGQRYQGRTINSTKKRKDGTKIKTLYYACGGWIMKGASCCERFLLRQAPLEDVLLETIRGRLDSLLAGEGEVLLRQLIDEELAAQGADPRREIRQVQERLLEIEQKANVLLEGLSAETKTFIDAKLRDLATEKRGLQSRLETLDAVPYEAIDVDAVLRDGLASLANLPRLMESASIEERKEFVHAFIGGVTVDPENARLDIQVRPLPLRGTANSSVGVVAGARYVPVQVELQGSRHVIVAKHTRGLAA